MNEYQPSDAYRAGLRIWDDLIVGTNNPYELFEIYCELVAAGDKAKDVAYMIDQSHNIEPKLEAVLLSVINCQTAYAKALIVDYNRLRVLQPEGDIVGAQQVLAAAFDTDVRPLLAQVRLDMNRPPNPIAAYRSDDWAWKVAATRGLAVSTGSAIQEVGHTDMKASTDRNHSAPSDLIELSHLLGGVERRYVISAEGNTSMRVDADSFWVKGSGHQLATVTANGFACVRFAPIMELFEATPPTLAAEREALRSACQDQAIGYPSVETTFHAMLLQDCRVACVAHTHPIGVNRLMCSQDAETFAQHRTCPDEVVLCGPESVFGAIYRPWDTASYGNPDTYASLHGEISGSAEGHPAGQSWCDCSGANHPRGALRHRHVCEGRRDSVGRFGYWLCPVPQRRASDAPLSPPR